MSVQTTLDKKVGPLPVAGWVMVVGAAVAFAMWRKRSAATTTATPSDQLSSTDQTVGNLNALLPFIQALQGGGPQMQGISDNVTWGKRALDYVLGLGYDPSLADAAIRKYTAGDALSQAEQAVIDTILRNPQIGAIPYPPPPPTTTPGPTQPVVSSYNLNTLPVNAALSAGLTHLSNNQLVNYANALMQGQEGVATAAPFAAATGFQTGIREPYPFINEIARRWQSGALGPSDLSGPLIPPGQGYNFTLQPQPQFGLTPDVVNKWISEEQAKIPTTGAA